MTTQHINYSSIHRSRLLTSCYRAYAVIIIAFCMFAYNAMLRPKCMSAAAAVSASIELNRSNPLLPPLTQRWSKVACGACHTHQYTVHSWMGLYGPGLTLSTEAKQHKQITKLKYQEAYCSAEKSHQCPKLSCDWGTLLCTADQEVQRLAAGVLYRLASAITASSKEPYA